MIKAERAEVELQRKIWEVIGQYTLWSESNSLQDIVKQDSMND